MPGDCYKTIEAPSGGYYAEKRSRFLAFAVPALTVEEIKGHIDACRKKYYDARHVCWAYMLGNNRQTFRANDGGEPSSTAGKPILGQINSNELTDVLIMVVRYFGGIELGTSGLASAYRAAAADAIANAQIIERTVDEEFTIAFGYSSQNSVMRILKEENPAILSREFDMDCRITLRIRQSHAPRLKERLLSIENGQVIIEN